MDTEIKNALALIREARIQIEEVRKKENLTKKQRNVIQRLLATIRDLDDLLVLEGIKGRLTELRKSTDKLLELTGQMEEKISGFKEAGKAVAKAAKGIAALSEIIAKAVSAGLL